MSSPGDRSGDYFLHDHQFSTVALMTSAATIVERIDYDSYGEARHHWSKDVNGDGAVSGLDLLWGALPKMIYEAGYDADADLDRSGAMDSTDLAQIQSRDYQAALPPGMMTDMTPGGGGADNIIGYGGYLFNGESYLYTVRHRHYDPSSSGGGGRWLERDPAGYVDGMSLYGYVAGSPVADIDPMGLATAVAMTEGGGKRKVTRRHHAPGRGPGSGHYNAMDFDTMFEEVYGPRRRYAGEIREALETGAEIAEALAETALTMLTPIPGDEAVAITRLAVKVAQLMDRVNKARQAVKIVTAFCFAAGTPVLTKDGPRAIDEIAVGELVWAADERTGDLALRPVTEVFERTVDSLVELWLVDGEGGLETLRVTAEHPILVVGEGWRGAGTLASGDQLDTIDGSLLLVAAVRSAGCPATVYNLEVGGDHTYFVGDAAAWAHNACKMPTGQKHHGISNPISKALEGHPNLRGHFKARDSRYVTPAKDGPSHQGYQRWHRDLDKEVSDWIGKHQHATPRTFDRYLRDRYSKPDLTDRFQNGF